MVYPRSVRQAVAHIDKLRSNELRPYDSRLVANWFIRHANKQGKAMSIMQVLKLVYMAHGWCLAVLDRPLIQNRIEAWKYGPVIPEIYFAFRPHGAYNIQPVEVYEREIDSDAEQLLQSVYVMYKDMSAAKLSSLTHMRNGPWNQIYRRKGNYHGIPDEVIARHFKEKLARSKND